MGRRLRGLWLVVVALLLATLVWWPMIGAAPLTADGDGRYFMHQWEAGKTAIRTYHEFPLWNPFDCRGVPLWDHPESLIGSPILLLATPLSATATLWVWSIVHCALGFVSMWLLARREVGLRRPGAFVASAMWAFGVAHVSQYSGSHCSLADFWLAPLLIYLWRRAETDWSAAVKLGLVVAFMVYEGATYPLPFTLLVVTLETLTRVTPVRRLPRIALAGVVSGIVAIGASAARLLPLADELLSKRRGNMLADVDVLARWSTLQYMFLAREPRWYQHLPRQQYVWGEYIAYVGASLLLLAALGLAISLREHRWVVGVAALTMLLMLGHFAKWAPWHLINRNVVPFSSMRVPSRFRLIFHMFLALWVGIATNRVPQLLERLLGGRRRWITIAPYFALPLIALGGLLDATALARDIVRRTHRGPPEQLVVPTAAQFSYAEKDLVGWLDQPKHNRAWTACRSYEWPAHEDAPVWLGEVPQARPKFGFERVLSVTNVVRTQNTFTVEVTAQAPGRVLLNSAFGRGWRSDVGAVVNDANLLAVDVPAGNYTFRARYWPRMLTPGIVLTSLTWIGIAAWYVLRRRAR